ncbi:4-hydroxy-tetrahydrodipicolinate reductase [bacterium]|nr:4-hydroxy-tetrahydrodipicolinate reductase [bacterium]
MIRILLSGAAGRMGRAIAEAAGNYDDIKITHKVDVIQGFENIDKIAGDDVDIAVDLSSREGFKKALSWAVLHKKPLVVGTTGLTEEDHAAIDSAAKEIAVLQASNLSRGVNIMFEILRAAAKFTHDADIEIMEMHHNKKKDAPSGTALEMGKIISEIQSERGLTRRDGRSGMVGAREANEIGYHAIRCGDVVGEHTTIFGFSGERIEISHKSGSRSVLAEGALSAARFLAGKKAGRYSMRDVITA